MSIIQKLVQLGQVLRSDRRLDSWQNQTTGLGTDRDKRTKAGFYEDWLIDDQTLENIYHGDSMAARVCNMPIDDALRKGVKVSLQNDADDEQDITQLQEDEAKILTAFKDLGALPLMADAAVWGRVFGGGAVLPIIDDSADILEEPLNHDNIRAIHSLLVLDKRALYIDAYDSDPMSKTFNQPLLYRLAPITKSGHAQSFIGRVHASRLITFEGKRATERRKLQNSGWGLSCIQLAYDVLREFNAGYDNAGVLLHEGSVGVFKMKGLIEALAGDGESALRTRMELMDLAKSVVRSIALDADGDEDYRRETVQFGSVPDMLDRFAQRFAAAVDMPLTKLMGVSPAGLNATGEHDALNWENHVQSIQTDYLQPGFEKLVKMLLNSKDGPTGGNEPDNWKIEWPTQRQMTDAQIAELRGKVAATDKIYVDIGAVTGPQVALSRFGKKGWDMETKIDVDAMEAEMDADKKAAELALKGGDPNNIDPADRPDLDIDPAPAPDPEPKDIDADPEDAVSPTTALNGAQVLAMKDIILAVANGELPRDTGVQMIAAAFPLSAEEANTVMGTVGTEHFQPTPKAAPPPPQPPAPPVSDDDADDDKE